MATGFSRNHAVIDKIKILRNNEGYLFIPVYHILKLMTIFSKCIIFIDAFNISIFMWLQSKRKSEYTKRKELDFLKEEKGGN